MLFSSFVKRLVGASVAEATDSPPTKPRRAATAMEYLFVVSLIIVVAIVGINYFADSVKQNLQQSHDAIQKAEDGNQSTSP
jgi:hypothetical protein